MKLYNIIEYFLKGNRWEEGLVVEEQGQRKVVLGNTDTITERTAKEILGKDVGELFMRQCIYYSDKPVKDIIQYGMITGVLKEEAVCLDPFLGFKKDDTIKFSMITRMGGVGLKMVGKDKRPLGDPWYSYRSHFYFKPGINLEEIVRRTLQDSDSEGYVKRNIMFRILKFILANGLNPDVIEFYQGDSGLRDIKKDWLIPALDPFEYLTAEELGDSDNVEPLYMKWKHI